MALHPVVDLNTLRDWIFRRLGAPVLRVELHEDQIDDAIQDALNWFSDRAGVESAHKLTILEGQSEYDVAALLGFSKEPPVIQNVLDVAFEALDTLFRDDFGFFYGAPFFGGSIAVGQGSGRGWGAGQQRGQLLAYSALMQWLQYIEQGKRILSVDRSWEYDEFSGILRVTPTPNTTSSAFVFLKRKLVMEEFPRLIERYRELVKKRSLLGAMERLIAVRGKYDSLPGAGKDYSLNADPLRAEADALKEETEDRITGVVKFAGAPWLVG
jgi:hypothetical protein